MMHAPTCFFVGHRYMDGDFPRSNEVEGNSHMTLPDNNTTIPEAVVV